MLSRQYLVPAKAFCMALAEAGLFAELKALRCFPATQLEAIVAIGPRDLCKPLFLPLLASRRGV